MTPYHAVNNGFGEGSTIAEQLLTVGIPQTPLSCGGPSIESNSICGFAMVPCPVMGLC